MDNVWPISRRYMPHVRDTKRSLPRLCILHIKHTPQWNRPNAVQKKETTFGPQNSMAILQNTSASFSWYPDIYRQRNETWCEWGLMGFLFMESAPGPLSNGAILRTWPARETKKESREAELPIFYQNQILRFFCRLHSDHLTIFRVLYDCHMMNRITTIAVIF